MNSLELGALISLHLCFLCQPLFVTWLVKNTHILYHLFVQHLLHSQVLLMVRATW